MSNTQKRGPGRPKGTKNQPGAKAGRPRKDAVKAKGLNPHCITKVENSARKHQKTSTVFVTTVIIYLMVEGKLTESIGFTGSSL